MIQRRASATWDGVGKAGTGSMSTESGVLRDMAYSFHTRFENEAGTNPEELIGAAHAGCFSMQFNFFLVEQGYKPEKIETKCVISMESASIKSSHLEVRGIVEGITLEKFRDIAQDALEKCPVSRALNVEKSVSVSLENRG